MKTNADFQTYYRSTLVNVVEGLEAERKKMVNWIYRAGALVVALLIISIVIGMFTSSPANTTQAPIDPYANQIQDGPMPVNSSGGSGITNIIFFALIGGGAGYYFWFKPKSNELKNRFKTQVISNIIKFIDPSLEYHPASGISRQEYEQSKIFLTSGDRYICEDLVHGTLGKTPIRFSEVHTQRQERQDNSEKPQWVTLFKGIVFIAEFNKHFKGRTVVLTDQAERAFGSFGAMFQKMNNMRDPLIQFENVDFEKAFVVYGTDPVEAHYILSPALMERIMSFKTLLGNIQLSFVNSNVYVSIPVAENLFEARIFSPLTNYGSLETYHWKLRLITGIVEDLNLNNRIWSKE